MCVWLGKAFHPSNPSTRSCASPSWLEYGSLGDSDGLLLNDGVYKAFLSYSTHWEARPYTWQLTAWLVGKSFFVWLYILRSIVVFCSLETVHLCFSSFDWYLSCKDCLVLESFLPLPDVYSHCCRGSTLCARYLSSRIRRRKLGTLRCHLHIGFA